jgi:hypothetical protein
MNLKLPDGYVVGPTKRRQQKVMHNLMGDEWQVTIYHKGYPAFEIAKRFDMHVWEPRFAGRLIGGEWQQFQGLSYMLIMMTSKHRILGGSK